MSAPRQHLTPADIDAAIVGEVFQRMEGTQITLCVLTMRNGARVAGINYGSIDPARQDWEHGARLARENAIAKVWELEGYALRERLAAAPMVATATSEQLAELCEAVRNAPSMPLVLEPIPGITWMAIDPANPATLPEKGYWLVTVDGDDGREVHVLWHSGNNKWLHEGEYTFQHGYYFRPIAWAPRPDGYTGEVLE